MTLRECMSVRGGKRNGNGKLRKLLEKLRKEGLWKRRTRKSITIRMKSGGKGEDSEVEGLE